MTINSLYNPKLLQEDFHSDITAYYFVEWDNYKMNTQHSHDRVEIMYVISGKCRVDIEDKTSNLSKGDFILIDANIPHALIVEKDTKCKMLNIEFAFIKKSGTIPSIRNTASNVKTVYELLKLNKSYLIIKDSKEIFLTLKSLIIELNKKNNDNDFLMQLLFLQIIINISIMVGQKSENCSMSNIHADKALSFINNNYDRDINIGDISANININESYLQRIFKTHTGYTIVDYITLLRLDKAKMLLANTSIPIIDLSNYIGINSRQYFTFLFKKHIGKTPAQYRKSVNINSNLNK
jgi:AraC family transcriptional regulator, melibiose operon regulatory protein